jgi:hypothetical protein
MRLFLFVDKGIVYGGLHIDEYRPEVPAEHLTELSSHAGRGQE